MATPDTQELPGQRDAGDKDSSLTVRAFERAVHERWDDLGRSKKGTGSSEFKAQGNLIVEPLNDQMFLVARKAPSNFSLLNPRLQLDARAWQELPLWLTRQSEPSDVRWFP